MADEATTIIANFKKTIQQANGYEIITANWSGEYDSLRTKSQDYYIGHHITSATIDFPEITSNSGAIVIANTLTRREGNLADLSISIGHYIDQEKNWFCSLDMVAVPKDIRTWKPSGEGEVAPDLTIIQYWEGMKENEPTYYAQFKYREPPATEGELGELKDIPEGNTKKLAEMMFQGVNSYTIHAPCITITTYYSSGQVYFDGEKIDCQYDKDWMKTTLNTYAIGAYDWGDIIANLANVWIFTDYKVTTQANGLTQITKRWIGADEAREELYPEA